MGFGIHFGSVNHNRLYLNDHDCSHQRLLTPGKPVSNMSRHEALLSRGRTSHYDNSTKADQRLRFEMVALVIFRFRVSMCIL